LINGAKSANPTISRVIDKPSFTLYDGGGGFGLHVLSTCIRISQDNAKACGASFGVVRNSTHCGALFSTAKEALDNGFIVLSWTNADSLLLSFNGNRASLGTNPILIGIKSYTDYIVCDSATSVVPWNKVRNFITSGMPLGDGWARDSFGNPTNKASDAKFLDSMGGYKGYALSFMFEVLTGVLAGGPIAKEIIPMYNNPGHANRQISHSFLLIDQKCMPQNIQDRVRDLMDMVRTDCPESSDSVKPSYPGEPEDICHKNHLKHGIIITNHWLSSVSLAAGDVNIDDCWDNS